ncbi:MAG: hypothetical protein WDW38_001678 [Sanguina aurantia]
MDFMTLQPYTAPSWAKNLHPVPKTRFRLGILPTPIHRWHVTLPAGCKDCEIWIKRDDLTGMSLSGNKVRKLEFLLAEAKEQGHDSVITIGGLQSNHCRATAVASRYVGLACHLLLRTSRLLVDEDPGIQGNLLVERMAGATLHMVTKEEYASAGSLELGQQLLQQLRAQGKNPYLIPVGGSNALGTWGYIEAVEEVLQQSLAMGVEFTDIVVACGSGGTTAGVALGNSLSGMGARVHGFGVCDDPDYFYTHMNGIFSEMGASSGGGTPVDSRQLVTVSDVKGQGYAASTAQELATVQAIASSTGIILDPVYAGKAMHGLLQQMQEPEVWSGRRVLFLHTGGLLGMWAQEGQLLPLLKAVGGPVSRMIVAPL